MHISTRRFELEVLKAPGLRLAIYLRLGRRDFWWQPTSAR